MAKKLKHDATSSIVGTIHQFYVALDYCFTLVSGETLFVEKFGDITVSDSKQIEVKKYDDVLSDLHENIWQTVSNWLQDTFHPSDYKELILLTTQDFSKTSSLKEWNKKTVEEKYALLKIIEEQYNKRKKKSKDKETLVSYVLSDSNVDKLKTILGRFIILDSSPKEVAYWNTIKDTKAGHIPSTNRDDYINSLLGFIIAPKTISSNGWAISYDNFTTRIQALTERYNSNTRIFPQVTRDVSEEELSNKLQHLFVRKIESINYDEVKSNAISAYIRTNQTILEELQKYSVPKNMYDDYEKDLTDFYEPKYRKANRDVFNQDKTEKESQDFYDEIMGSAIQQFSNFNNTPPYFRNGTLHNMADDESQDIKWKLNIGAKDE